jgi:hypothetical protein
MKEGQLSLTDLHRSSHPSQVRTSLPPGSTAAPTTCAPKSRLCRPGWHPGKPELSDFKLSKERAGPSSKKFSRQSQVLHEAQTNSAQVGGGMLFKLPPDIKAVEEGQLVGDCAGNGRSNIGALSI